MEQFLGRDMPEEARRQMLEDSCDAMEEIGYTRRFSPEELSQKKESLAELSISINDIEVEKTEAMQFYKEKLKPLNEDKKELLTELKNKSVYVNDKCFKFIDHEERMVGYYNADGELVSSRPIMPQEMQKTTFSINRKTGTEG